MYLCIDIKQLTNAITAFDAPGYFVKPALNF